MAPSGRGFPEWAPLAALVLLMVFAAAAEGARRARAAKEGRRLGRQAAAAEAARRGQPLVELGPAPGLLAWLRAQPSASAVIFEDGALEAAPPEELRPLLAELRRVSGGAVFAHHGRAVDSQAYALTGARQPLRLGVAARPPPGVRRLFTAYPPHDPYRWVEFAGLTRFPVADSEPI
jgi:hypothetical protein